MRTNYRVVDDIMNKAVISIDEKLTVGEAHDLMTENYINKIIVTREDKPEYIISEWKTWTYEATTKLDTLKNALERVHTVISGTLLTSIYTDLIDNSAIIVTDENKERMIGVITATDLLSSRE